MITDADSTNTELEGIAEEVREVIEVTKHLMYSIRILLTKQERLVDVICDITMHWKNDCLHFQMFMEELVQEHYLDTLVGETFSSAMLESGCTNSLWH